MSATFQTVQEIYKNTAYVSWKLKERNLFIRLDLAAKAKSETTTMTQQK